VAPATCSRCFAPDLRLQARRLAEEIAAMPTIDDVVDTLVGRTGMRA